MKIINFLRSRLRKYFNEEIWLEDYIRAGLKIGEGCKIDPGTIFDISHCWLIEIGNNVTIAPQTYILAHDASMFLDLGYTKIGKVIIEDDVFIGCRSLILPGVKIGRNSIVASGSVVTSSVIENTVVGGNPAKFIISKEEFLKKHMELMKKSNLYDVRWTLKGGISREKKDKMLKDLKDGFGYVI